MTGRNRGQRLSDAQRSALWFFYRGKYMVLLPADPAETPRFVDREGYGPGVRRSVVLALISRGLISRIESRLAPTYGLTERGLEVAREVAEQIDPRQEGRGLA